MDFITGQLGRASSYCSHCSMEHAFSAIQLALGIAFLCNFRLKETVVASLIWCAIVWIFSEGFGQLFTGQTLIEAFTWHGRRVTDKFHELREAVEAITVQLGDCELRRCVHVSSRTQ